MGSVTYKNARTTPAIRADLAASGDSAAALAQRFGITEATVYKWKKRTSVHDASHTPHRLQTTFTPAQERVVVELRRTLLLPLDDLLAVTREFICLGVRADQEKQDGGQRQGVSQCRAPGLSDAHSEGAHRQRPGVH